LSSQSRWFELIHFASIALSVPWKRSMLPLVEGLYAEVRILSMFFEQLAFEVGSLIGQQLNRHSVCTEDFVD